MLALIISTVYSVTDAYSPLNISFDLRPIGEIVKVKIDALPPAHYSFYNNKALLSLAYCFKEKTSFDVKNIEEWEEAVRRNYTNKLNNLHVCSEDLLTCYPSSLSTAIDRYMSALILTSKGLCQNNITTSNVVNIETSDTGNQSIWILLLLFNVFAVGGGYFYQKFRSDCKLQLENESRRPAEERVHTKTFEMCG